MNAASDDLDALLEEYPSEPQTGDDTPRRGFFAKLLALILWAIAGLAPLASGLLVALDPVLRRKKGTGDFIVVARLESVPADGKPRMFRVRADRQDAWTRYIQVPIGAVYLRRTEDKPDEIIAFNSTCPHLGCFVNAEDDGTYTRPCHKASFDADGGIGPKSVSPRPLDSIECKIDGEDILVRFQNFIIGIQDKVPLS